MNKLQAALKSLLDAPANKADEMNTITNEIRQVQKTLETIQFVPGDAVFVSVEINGHDNELWRLGYDFRAKQIYCQPKNGKAVALLEQKFRVREYMIEFLPDLLKTLEYLK